MKLIHWLLGLAGGLLLSGIAQGSVVFDWICDDPTCSGDTGFSFSIEFTDTAVATGMFTGITGNVVSATISSSVGNGYTNTLADLMEGDNPNDQDQSNFSVIFSADKLFVDALYDAAGSLLTFSDTEGSTVIREGNSKNYLIDRRIDSSPSHTEDSRDIAGVLQRRAVPEPTTLALMGLGLAGIGYRRKRKLAA